MSSASITATVLMPIVRFIIQPAEWLLLIFATLVFVWGVAQLILKGEDATARAEAQQHILWGVIGLFIMIAVYGIIRFVANTIGVSDIPLFN
jgi:hypothetical protein